MKTSVEGLNLIKDYEGLRLEAYYCPSGILTIGYGHTGPDVWVSMVITESEAERLLQQDLAKFEDGVKEFITVPLNQNQFDALVSFTYNVGIGALQNSTLRKRLNAGEEND
jgi:lysozyme